MSAAVQGTVAGPTFRKLAPAPTTSAKASPPLGVVPSGGGPFGQHDRKHLAAVDENDAARVDPRHGRAGIRRHKNRNKRGGEHQDDPNYHKTPLVAISADDSSGHSPTSDDRCQAPPALVEDLGEATLLTAAAGWRASVVVTRARSPEKEIR